MVSRSSTALWLPVLRWRDSGRGWGACGGVDGASQALTGTHGELARAALPPTSMIVGPESPGATGRPFLGRTDLIAHAR